MRIFCFDLPFELCFTSLAEPVQVSTRGARPARIAWQLELRLLPRDVRSQTLPVGHSFARVTPCRYNLGAFLLLLGPSRQDEAAGLLRSAHAVCWNCVSCLHRFLVHSFFTSAVCVQLIFISAMQGWSVLLGKDHEDTQDALRLLQQCMITQEPS